MNRNITKKLDHEKGKLRDKAQNPDYRERFHDEGGHFDRGGTHGNQPTMADPLNFSTAFRKSMAQNKDTARIVLDNKLWTLPLKVNGYIFSFKYQNNPTAFAEANKLPLAEAKRVLPGLRANAAQWLDMTRRRFDRAAPHGRPERDPATGEERLAWYITFRTFLPTAEPQPWHTFFKRLRLDPVESEPAIPGGPIHPKAAA
jgi:hypothetical protein